MTIKAGEYNIKAGDMALNTGRYVQTITVINTGDRPIQIGSHYHFFEVNAALSLIESRRLAIDSISYLALRYVLSQDKRAKWNWLPSQVDSTFMVFQARLWAL